MSRKRKFPKEPNFWEPNEYGEYGIVAIMEDCEHWRERKKRHADKEN